MSARRPLPTHPSASRAALVVLAHRRDAAGVPWSRAPIADADALATALGHGVTAGFSPVIAVIGRGDPPADAADDVVEVDPAADDSAVLAAVHGRLARTPGAEPLHVVLVPVEQPLAAGTLLWTLVAACEDRPGVLVAAGHEGLAGHPRVVGTAALAPGAPVAPLALVEAGELALFWSADAAGALEESIGVRARALQAAVAVRRHPIGGGVAAADLLAAEEPLEIHLRTESLAVLMRTPGHDTELATGFLVTESVVEGPAEVRGVEVLGNHAHVDVEPEVLARTRARRSFLATSACGVCGKSSIDEVVLHFPRVRSSLTVSSAFVQSLPGRLAERQAVFARTGGLHAAALFAPDGTLLVLREDVGRHNAVDKVVGWAARAGALPLRETLLVVSGRIGFEIAQKATAAGLPIVVAVGAPSSLAVALAEQSGVTLVGFVRQGRGNVYTHPERIAG